MEKAEDTSIMREWRIVRMANEVTQVQNLGITAYLNRDDVKRQLNQAVGKNVTRFVSSVVSAVTANQGLQKCSNASILSGALLGESLNLSPSPQLGHYYLVPYSNKNEEFPIAQFQMGYKGYIQLAIRSGQYKKMNVISVKKGELVRFDPLNEEIEVKLIEDEEERERAKTVGYYAMFEYINGFRKAMYWSKAKMVSHADRYSQAFYKDAKDFYKKDFKSGEKELCHRVSFSDYEDGNYPEKDSWMYSSFWYKDFDAMAYKTMLRQLISKWGIMSIEIQKAFDFDMSAVESDGGKRYIDNEPEPEVFNPYEKAEEKSQEDLEGQQQMTFVPERDIPQDGPFA